jgi:hypothetical protein
MARDMQERQTFENMSVNWKVLNVKWERGLRSTGSGVILFEAQNLLGCNAMFLIGCRSTFQRCVLPPSWGRPDDGGRTHLLNVGRHPIKNTAVHLRRFWASYSPPWELEISYSICNRQGVVMWSLIRLILFHVRIQYKLLKQKWGAVSMTLTVRGHRTS